MPDRTPTAGPNDLQEVTTRNRLRATSPHGLTVRLPGRHLALPCRRLLRHPRLPPRSYAFAPISLTRGSIGPTWPPRPWPPSPPTTRARRTRCSTCATSCAPRATRR